MSCHVMSCQTRLRRTTSEISKENLAVYQKSKGLRDAGKSAKAWLLQPNTAVWRDEPPSDEPPGLSMGFSTPA